MEKLTTLAQILDSAAANASPVNQLSHQNTFTVDQAYEIQQYAMQKRYERGEKLIGLKMGFITHLWIHVGDNQGSK